MFHDRYPLRRKIAAIGLALLGGTALEACSNNANHYTGKVSDKNYTAGHSYYIYVPTLIGSLILMPQYEYSPPKWDVDIKSCDQNDHKGCETFDQSVSQSQYDRLYVGEKVSVYNGAVTASS